MKILLIIFILTGHGPVLAIQEVPDVRGYSMGGSLVVCEKAALALKERLTAELWLKSDKVVTICLEVS